ncbi:MAG: tryptophan synthase subunit alpha [Oscillospiraceae bacterium]|nr:tryptophan synthase subunit alpha [Oscillospiraceae bacterium]
MSERIRRAFAARKAFIPFITAGDPSMEVTEQLVYALEAAGADLIELGIPFSDPVAEGPVIQAASERALAAGFTTDKLFEMTARLRKRTDIALAFMTYLNPVYAYGKERFVRQAAECGVDALIVPDLPFEEKDELAPLCEQYGLAFISLIAPTSRGRALRIAAEAQGFVYCVSSMGVTGMRARLGTEIGGIIRLVKESRDIPCAIGFGVSTPEQARDMAELSDGVIIGSAIVDIAARHGKDCAGPVREFAEKIRAVL